MRALLLAAALLAPSLAIGQQSAPPFPITVDSTVTATRVNSIARIQVRTQDYGVTVNIFSFALAPRALVTNPDPNDAGDCLLAQLSTGGQLIGVRPERLQPSFSGAVPPAGVNIILVNNVPTPALAGAQFFLGYGQDATSMLVIGMNQPVLSVPGTPQCPPTLVRSPGAMTGLFWNPNESGWGLHLTQRGTTIFAAWFTYDENGKAKWYVATCVPGASTAAGSCSGTFYEVHGPRFPAQPFDPAAVHATAAGTLQLAFTDNNHGTMQYAIGSVSRAVAIERQPFPSSAPVLIDHTDMWWNPVESGWGAGLTQKDSTIFLAWYVYNDAGDPTWYVATCTPNAAGTGWSGTLYATTGPPFGTTFDPTQVQATSVGIAVLSFDDANNGVLGYTVNGVTGSKPITRQVF